MGCAHPHGYAAPAVGSRIARKMPPQVRIFDFEGVAIAGSAICDRYLSQRNPLTKPRHDIPVLWDRCDAG